ncbi:MAG: cystathionine gamma-synthase [Actinomycetota bacterium]
MTDGMRFETRAIHSGQDPDSATGAAVVPIYQTSTFVQDAVGAPRGFEYARTDNPTRHALETCMAALDDASHGIAFGSGMAALATLGMTLTTGDRVLIPDDVYGGTYRLFDKVFAGLGIEYQAVDMTDVDAIQQALDGGAALVIIETPSNPLLKVCDIARISQLAHSVGAKLLVDNTFATPFLQQPLELGADAVWYSATKYLGGHSDLVAGVITTSDEELASRLRFLQNAAGAIPGPFDCWLLLRGLKTLGIRMRAHSANADRVAMWLAQRDDIVKVYFPGLPQHLGHDLAAKQMAASGEPLYGGMVSFELASEERALEVCARTKLFFLGESLGGVESLIEHPHQMTHASLAGSGMEVSPGLIRLSVGIEHPDDLIADLERALS